MSQNNVNVYINITVCVSSSKYNQSHESTSAGLTLPANDIGEFPKSVFRMLWQAAVNDFREERLAAIEQEEEERAEHGCTSAETDNA